MVGEARPVHSVTPPTGDEPADVVLDVEALGQRAVRQLVVRAIVVRAITLLGTIALARLLTPAEFGAFAVVTLIVAFISLVGDFGTSAAIIQQDHNPTDLELSTAFVTQVGTSSLLAIVIWIVAGAIPSVRSDLPPDVTEAARTLAVALFLGGLRAIPTVMLSRVLRFGPLAVVEIGQQIVYFGAAVVLAAASFGIMSFALAALAQGLFATVVINLAWGHWLGVRFDVGIARRLWAFGIRYQVGQALAWGREAVVPALGGLGRRAQRDRLPRLRLAQRAARQCRGPDRPARRVPGLQPPPARTGPAGGADPDVDRAGLRGGGHDPGLDPDQRTRLRADRLHRPVDPGRGAAPARLPRFRGGLPRPSSCGR